MIAQCIEIMSPERVSKLVLAVTSSKTNEMINNVVGNWIKLAEREDFKNIFIDIAEKSHSEKYLEKYRRYYNILEILQTEGLREIYYSSKFLSFS